MISGTETPEALSGKVFYDKNAGFPPEVQAVMERFNKTIGQTHLKRHLEKMCFKAIKQKRLKELSPNVKYGAFSYHMVFRGNPGTGKTMLAGIIGDLMVSLGVIPKSNFRVVQLHEIKAKYVGQTPHLMAEVFKSPGVYFLDEAYQIMKRTDDSFGGEILSCLCEILENRRHEIVVIMAGYVKTKSFYSSN